MGRWGLRLFEGDLDTNVRSDILHDMGITIDADDGFELDKELKSTELREKLNSGLCDKLFKDFRSKEGEVGFHKRKIHTVMLAAMIMITGAKINDDNMQHLRKIVPQIKSLPVYVSAYSEVNLFHPGKAQFLAALEYYKPGIPRDFSEPSCYHCGKTKADLGKKLSYCAKCKQAYYCNQDCQKADWKAHKPSCFDYYNPPLILSYNVPSSR